MAPQERQVEFTHLLRENYRQMFSYVLSMVQHLDDAQDILQETNKTLWEKFDEYDDSKPFVGWACGIARYKVLQHLEKVARRGESVNTDLVTRLSDVWEGRQAETGDERLIALRGCVDKLDAQQRRLVLACYDGTRSVRQMAQELDRTPSSVHNSLQRIRLALLTCIKRSLREGDAR